MAPRRVTDGSLSERDLRFQRRLWTVERAAWWVQLALVAGALLGLLGGGPMSRGSARSSALEVAYGRFVRNAAPGELRVEVGPSLVRGDELALELDARWLSGVTVVRTVPEPERSEAGPAGTTFTFRTAPGRTAHVRFDLEYAAAGARRGRLRIPQGPEVTFRQWVYP